jgi:Sortase domain
VHLERRLFGLVAAELIAGGVGLAALGVTAPRYAQPPISLASHRSPTPALAAEAAARRTPTPSAALARSAPQSIAIPALGVASRFGPARGLNTNGTVNDAPLSGPVWSLPWWYDYGPSPGQRGSAVLLGHVDSAVGAGHLGVFFRLGEMQPGEAIEVRLADGVLTRWTAVSTVVYRDSEFPDAAVYDTTGLPTLRLVTCGGPFDWRTHHYESAVVVTAVETA